MNLKDFIRTNGLKQIFIADKLGISSCHLSLIMNGNTAPSKNLAIRIEHLTRGIVTKEEVMFPASSSK